MADLITYLQFARRMGPVAAATLDRTQVEEFITDVSALVRDAASGELDDVDHTTPTPGVIVPVVVSAVRRCLVNPDGDSSEMLDGHRVDGRNQSGLFLSDEERAIVRTYAGVALSARSLPLTSDVPTPKTESVPLEEVGWVSL